MDLINWKTEYQKLEKKYKAMMAQRVDYSKAFDKFWAAYPWKTEKKTCYKHWCKLKLTKELYTTIMQGLIDYKASHNWLKEQGKWIPKPKNFIVGEMWNDEIVPHYPGAVTKPTVPRCNHCGTAGDVRNPVRDVVGIVWCRACFQRCGDNCMCDRKEEV